MAASPLLVHTLHSSFKPALMTHLSAMVATVFTASSCACALHQLEGSRGQGVVLGPESQLPVPTRGDAVVAVDADGRYLAVVRVGNHALGAVDQHERRHLAP